MNDHSKNQILTEQCQYRQIKFHIIKMTSYLVRDNHLPQSSFSKAQQKIKNYIYSSDDKIGKGFSSIVYRGTNQITNQVVAIKVIDMKGVKDKVSKEMLDCQIQALTKLKHPNILKCYDVIREISHCYIVTEYCNQGDLSSLLKKKRRMPEAEVIKIMNDIISGFIEIGENKFLHRDLKLANIFMNNGVAKIADFGFAKKSYASFEREKYNVGSPLYMSPEALKKNIYSTKNDIWSIGIMIYEMLHGETPWQCRTEAQLIQKITKVPIKFRQSLKIDENIKDFIQKCLEVDQTKRMNLAALKQWCTHNNVGYFPTDLMVKRPQKHYKQEESNRIVKPLGDATNRYSLGIQKIRSLSNVMPKLTNQVKIHSTHTNQDKQNNRNVGVEDRPKLSKVVINKNNSLILIEINKFRLLYKIYQKIRLTYPDEKQLLDSLGTDILRRVENMVDIIVNAGSEKCKQKAQQLGLKQLDSYLREEMNSSIKKYVAVVKQYHKKYTTTIQICSTYPNSNCNQMLRSFLSTSRLNKDLSKDQNLMFYWTLEAINLRIDVSKQELDLIIEARSLLTKEQLLERVKELL